ncbi:aminotransferase class V-fold PLP-dependent enzyme [Burkholderia sp.]|uniref:aminotransferase class V-fold PLP-dependent enzyme n=1 Tax=Burkholderia sp. TaxID=36773 RepID=UPI0035DD8CD4
MRKQLKTRCVRSAHKLCGPKGIGALYVSCDVAKQIAPQMNGSGHERGLRSDSLPTHQIVGIGVARELAASEMIADNERIAQLVCCFLDVVAGLEVVFQNAVSAKHMFPRGVSRWKRRSSRSLNR